MSLKGNRGNISLIVILLVVLLVLGAGAYVYLYGESINRSTIAPTPTISSQINTPFPTLSNDTKPYTQAGVQFSLPADWYSASFSTESQLYLYSYPEDKTDPERVYDGAHPAPQGEGKIEILSRSKSTTITLEEWLKTEADNYDYFGDRTYSTFEETQIGNTSGFKIISSMYTKPFYVFQNSSGNTYFIISGNQDGVSEQMLEEIISSVKI